VRRLHRTDAARCKLTRARTSSDTGARLTANITRKIGVHAASVVGKAAKAMGPLADEIRDAIDEVREEGGGASDLAHELWDPKA
jgi:hypothetical protein